MSADPSRPAFAFLGSRGMAFVFDLVLVTVLLFAVGHAAMAMGVRPPAWTPYVIAALYFGLLPATPLQATPGKRMVGLRISDRGGGRIGILPAMLRLVAFVPSIGLAGAGFIVAAFTPRRQALHDLVAGTLVVNVRATPADIAREPVPTSSVDRFVLVAGFALVWFGGYKLWEALDGRNRHDEAIALMVATHPYKEEVAKALRSGAPVPAPAKLPRQARAMSARPDGTIVIEVSDDLAPGARITLRPEAVGKGEYLWNCRAEGIRYVPVECRPQAPVR